VATSPRNIFLLEDMVELFFARAAMESLAGAFGSEAL